MTFLHPKFFARSAGLFAAILEHPFNQKLAHGRLSPRVFGHYLEQDTLYLRDFSQALGIIGRRFTNERYSQQFQYLSERMLLSELKIHTNYLQQALFFKPPRPIKTPITDRYTRYLLTMSKTAPLEEAVASCVPCLSVYAALGHEMMRYPQDKNPYKSWISSYSSDWFIKATLRMNKTCYALCEGDPRTERKVSEVIEEATRFELEFFDSIEAPEKHALAVDVPRRSMGF